MGVPSLMGSLCHLAACPQRGSLQRGTRTVKERKRWYFLGGRKPKPNTALVAERPRDLEDFVADWCTSRNLDMEVSEPAEAIDLI